MKNYGKRIVLRLPSVICVANRVIKLISGQVVDATRPFVSGRERPEYQRRQRGTNVDEPGEELHSIGSRFICRINVEEVFLMADNSGLIVIWGTYYRWTSYPGGIDAANKTDTHLSPFSSPVLTLISTESLTFPSPQIFFLLLFSIVSPSHLSTPRAQLYTISFVMIIQIGCVEELFI